MTSQLDATGAATENINHISFDLSPENSLI